MCPLRVLHLTSEYPPFIWGGLGTAVGGLVKASAQHGLRTSVLLIGGILNLHPPSYAGLRQGCFHQPSEAMVDHDGVTFFHILPEEGMSLGIQRARQWNPDVVHVHSAWLWRIAERIRQEIGVPIVFTVHSLDRAEYEIGRFENDWTLQTEAIRHADRVIAISQSERELLCRYQPEVASRVRVVGNGIDDNGEASQALGERCPENGNLIVYSGRLVERKGIAELFSAIPTVLEQAPSAKFVVVGGYGSGPEIAQRHLDQSLRPWSDRIHFTGWLSPQGVAEWYRRAPILVVPSWYEPFGMVILEGMLYGMAIAASNVGGPSEILEDERTGILFPPKDSSAVANALLRLVHSPQLRKRLACAAAKEVRAKWLWSNVIEKMQAVYAEVA